MLLGYPKYPTYQDLIMAIHYQLNLPSQLLKAALKYDRAWFLPEDKKHLAYVDAPILITDGQTTSQPYTILYMLKLLDVQSGQRILEIGTGVGWQTAILSELVGKSGKIYSFEVNKTMFSIAKENLTQLGITNIILSNQNALEEAPNFKPYDRIIGCAGFSKKAIDQFINLLAPNGIAIIPQKEGGLFVYKNYPTPFYFVDEGFVFVRGRE